MKMHTSGSIGQRLNEFEDIWCELALCTTRGISLYSEDATSFEYHSYSDLIAYSAAAAEKLRGHGICRMDRVLISARTSSSFIVHWLGLMLLGAIPVPLPPKKTLAGDGVFTHRIRPLLEQHRFFLCHPEETGEILECVGPEQALTLIPLGEDLDGFDGSVGRQLLTGLFRQGGPWGAYQTPDDDAFIQYTSGSTGQPKGTVISVRNLFTNVCAITEALQVRPESDTFVSWLPFYHDMGLVGMLLTCTLSTTSLVLVSPQTFATRPRRFLKLLQDVQATHCVMPNFALEWILRSLERPGQGEARLDSIRWFGVGSEPIGPETLRRFQREMAKHGLAATALSPCYGLAEATLAVSCSSPESPFQISHHLGQEVPCVGRIVRGFDVAIEPTEGEGHAGMIKIRGDSVSRYAYVGNTKIDRLDSDGFYATGDIGFFHGEELVILGRADEMFIINGVNYFPYDIEMLVRELPGIARRRVACFGVRADHLSPSSPYQLVVLYETNQLSRETMLRNEETIRAATLGKVGVQIDSAIPVRNGTIPVTTSGKIQRRKAKALYLAGAFEQNLIPADAEEQPGLGARLGA